MEQTRKSVVHKVGGSLMISLPHRWVSYFNIRKGDVVLLRGTDHSLEILKNEAS